MALKGDIGRVAIRLASSKLGDTLRLARSSRGCRAGHRPSPELFFGATGGPNVSREVPDQPGRRLKGQIQLERQQLRYARDVRRIREIAKVEQKRIDGPAGSRFRNAEILSRHHGR